MLRAFVTWAVSHGYMAADLEVPWRPSREERRAIDDEDRIALAGRLLRDQDKEPRDRLGAVLILLFGQPATRLARLRASAVSRDDDGRVYLALGDTPVRLREPLAHLAITVADSARRLAARGCSPAKAARCPATSSAAGYQSASAACCWPVTPPGPRSPPTFRRRCSRTSSACP